MLTSSMFNPPSPLTPVFATHPKNRCVLPRCLAESKGLTSFTMVSARLFPLANSFVCHTYKKCTPKSFVCHTFFKKRFSGHRQNVALQGGGSQEQQKPHRLQPLLQRRPACLSSRIGKRLALRFVSRALGEFYFNFQWFAASEQMNGDFVSRTFLVQDQIYIERAGDFLTVDGGKHIE